MMNKLNDLYIKKDATIKDALFIINQGEMQTALVVDDQEKLIGIISDGDIRRGLLDGLELSCSIEGIINHTPIIGKENEDQTIALKKAIQNKVRYIPILNAENKVVDIKDASTGFVNHQFLENPVVLMAGGLGTRLHPLTEETPKPLLKVGGVPILETIINNFVSYGLKNIFLCIGYKGDLIQEYFKDGSQFGTKIHYVKEEKKLGTAGALTLLKDQLKVPFFVMNADLLTNLNFKNMLQYHYESNCQATMGVRKYSFKVPYGVVKMNDQKITSITEKPMHQFYVSGGIYILSPETINLIPKNEYYDMPQLFDKLIAENKECISFPIHEYWLDIGKMKDYDKANDDFSSVF